MKSKKTMAAALDLAGVVAAASLMGTAAAVSVSYFFYLWLLEAMRLVAAQSVPFFR